MRYGLPDAAVGRLQGVFQEWPGIDRVWLYGSRAKGNYRPGSDIDLSIESDTLSLEQLLAIENQIDDLLLPWMVDLSLLRSIENPALLEHIRRAGQVFYECPQPPFVK